MLAPNSRFYAVVCAHAKAPSSYILRFVGALPVEFHKHAVLLALVVIYWICGLVVAHTAGMPLATTITTYLPTFRGLVPAMIVALLVGRCLTIMVVERPARPLTQIGLELRNTLATPERIAHAIPVLASLLAFGGTFTVVKASIPSLMPFAWDVPFEHLDRWLHGGVAPWELLQPIIGVPIITHTINWFYNFWFYVLGFVLIWQAFSHYNNRLRLQFFITLMLGWILLGNVAAILFSSAGPCYFGQVTGLPDPFVPLLAYLRTVDQSYAVWAIRAQDILWHTYSMHDISLGAGISAMPSMHVAVATLIALVCWRTKRWVGMVMSFYALIILIGSVHLAWHYAIDGYAGAAGIMAVWWIVGRALARHDAIRRLAITDTA
jgi:hypothetical protein